MENIVKEKGNSKGIITVILFILFLAAVGFICYDKLLKKEDSNSKDCNCPKCEKCSNSGNTIVDDEFDEEDRKLKTCTIDLNGKSEVNKNQIDKACGEDFFGNSYREVIIKNVKIKDMTFNVKYLFEGLYSEPDDRFIKVYVNDTLFELHKAIYSNALSSIKVKEDLLELTEYSFTDIPAFTRLYDIYGGSARKDVIQEDY